jgi:AhpD family alkylhydroperoxidase
MRSELRSGVLPQATRERIALAVAEHRDDTYSIAQHAKSARRAGLGLDEVSKARSFESGDEKETTLLTYLKATLEADGRPPHHLHEEALESGWTERRSWAAHLALNEFRATGAGAAALPESRSVRPWALPSVA